ncbi:translation initiation factor eIF3 subunit g [Dispira simplex]|nr:translation initiation factor eIF3 subunit g [Dispira simplex]
MTNVMKQDWADDIEEFETQPTPATTAAPEDSDIKTIVEYKTNDEGKKVKVTRKIRMKLITEKVNKVVAERKKWPKFGREAGNKPGPDSATTALGDEVFLKLMSGYKEVEVEDSQAKMRSALKGKNIVCRICKGDHFTTKCPYKDTLQPLQDLSGAAEGAVPPAEPEADEAAAGGAIKGTYVPPHLRGKGGVAAASMEGTRERRDDLPTLRITNLSADTQEADLQELCRPFGALGRVFLAKDRETGTCKGFAFVSYYNKEDAERALQSLSGFGYDNLILHVEWAKQSS